jgi:hypothetical protein
MPPGDEVVLGGGAQCITAGSASTQRLLVASKPYPDTDGSTPTGWRAVCKDHEISQLGSAVAYVISIPRLNGRLYASRTTAFAGPAVSSGYSPLNFNVFNAAITGAGGETTARTGGGRLLTSIWPMEVAPTTGKLHIDSKDHVSRSEGQSIG